MVLRFEIVDPASAFGEGLAYLTVIELAMALFNLIPIPPLDGFGAIAAHLSEEAQAKARSFGQAGYFLLILVMWNVPALSNHLWGYAYDWAYALGVSPYAAYYGWFFARLR